MGDTEAMTTDEKFEIEEKVADALEENFEKHDVVARAHTGDNTEEETEEDEVMDGEKVGDEMENSNFKQAVEDLTACLTKRIKALPADSRSIAETHYQLGVAEAHCAEYANAGKSLAAAVAVLNIRIANLKKMKVTDDITKELAELTLLCTEIKERTTDHKEMQKGTYKEDKDFVSIFKGAEVHEICTKKAVATA